MLTYKRAEVEVDYFDDEPWCTVSGFPEACPGVDDEESCPLDGQMPEFPGV